MEIAVADQRIVVLKPQISFDEAKKTSWEKKTTAFDAFMQVASFLSRPKDEDFELNYSETRYQPFWHVTAKARYVYDRKAEYQIPLSGTVVRSVTLQGADFRETNHHIHVPVVEHCVQEEAAEVFMDGVSAKTDERLSRYLKFATTVVKGKIESVVTKNAILVPPQTRVSAIVRDSLAKMIKGIQADTILEEHVEVSCVDLYYRPVYAFQYRWTAKNKDAIVEVDGVTGETTSGNRIFSEYLGKVLDQNFLFDIGADAAGIFIPGGSIAVKAAKRYIDSRKKS